MDTAEKYAPTAGRILIALLFILAGLSKIPAPEMNVGYMEAYGVPGILFWPSVLVEVGAGLLLLAGFKTRWAALALIAFTLLASFIFHLDFADPMQVTALLKNLAIVGGLLYVVVHGPGPLSVERR